RGAAGGDPRRGRTPDRAGDGAGFGPTGGPSGRPHPGRSGTRARERGAGAGRSVRVTVPIEPLGEWRRSDLGGRLRAEDVGRTVTLCGWVHGVRDHGGLLFIDLRDHVGLVQVVCNPRENASTHARAGELRHEFVVAVRGLVQARPPDTANPELPTGAIEVVATALRVLNAARPVPFPVDDAAEVNEANRLRYRYLDLRRPAMQQRLRLRHEVTRMVRARLEDAGFIEVETPILTRSTPEGARDYLVPSRVQRGAFYALPQSPQLFKQILMVGGVDRYYQIVRCFRDEDLRADRQPEFTQIDLEMSFVTPADVMGTVEQLITVVFRTTRNSELTTPFPRLAYQDAMDRYGSDKPDLRFDMPLHDLREFAVHTEFKVFKETIANGGIVKALIVKGGGGFPRSRVDALGEKAKSFGAKGL